VLYGIAIEAAMLLCVLIGWRWLAIFWAVAVGGGSLVMLVFIGSWQHPARMVQGTIEVIGPQITQNDIWAFQNSPDLSYSRLRWNEGLHLILSAPEDWPGMDPRLQCFANGTPDILFFNLLAKHKVAVFGRRCGPRGPAITPALDGTSPMHIFARDLYLKKGDRILGEVPTTPLLGDAYYKSEQWPAVVIGRPTADQE
jgi:hypothetical protein